MSDAVLSNSLAASRQKESCRKATRASENLHKYVLVIIDTFFQAHI